ncbi:MAG: DoxX family protein [Ginsengibacter sp.]
MEKRKKIAYWITTSILAFSMISGGVAELVHRKENIVGLVQLGYPVYFIMIIGFWKTLGGTAILIPRFPLLKEWAYAGIFFNMTGAAISNAVIGNPVWHIIVDLTLTGLAVASWALRPPSRKIA